MLFRKMLRDLKLNVVQFLSIFIMTMGAMFVSFGFAASNTGNAISATEYFTKTNYKDLDITGRSFDYGDIRRLELTDGISAVDGVLHFTGKAFLDKEYPMVISYISGNNVSSMLLKEGEEYKPGSRGIWLEFIFAQKKGLKPGDTFRYTINQISYEGEIKGLVYSPEYIYYVPNNTFTEPEYGSHGFMIMDISEAPVSRQVYDELIVDLKNVTGQGSVLDKKDKIEMVRMKSVITRRLDDKTLLIKSKTEVDSYSDYTESMGSTDSTSLIFVALFMAVACLGIITTMTRLTDKQRTIIGAMKALGFSRAKITVHYLSYTTVVTLFGAACGAVAGTFIFGGYLKSINDYYYQNPYNRLQIQWSDLLLPLAAVLLSAVVSFLCTRKLLIQNASDILRPEPPKHVGEWFMEKLPVWNKLKFALRWNIRDVRINLFRTIVSIFGIAVCSLLIFAAIGFYRNLEGMPEWMYGSQVLSTSQITFEDDASLSVVSDYRHKYGGQLTEEKDATLYLGDTEIVRSLTVVEDGNLFLVQDDDLDYITLPSDGIVLTSKAASSLEADEGDVISFRVAGEDKTYKASVKSICRFAGSQGIVMSDTAWKAMGGTFSPNVLYTRKSVPASLDKRPGVSRVDTVENLYKTMENSNEIGYTISIIMIAMGIIMGIVVLYNLGILSYTEKQREIATLKVLGFQTASIRGILLQQNLTVTTIGAVLGIPGGIGVLYLLNDLFMGDYADMVVNVDGFPFLGSVIGIFVVSVAANMFITQRVKSIELAEALKGVE